MTVSQLNKIVVSLAPSATPAYGPLVACQLLPSVQVVYDSAPAEVHASVDSLTLQGNIPILRSLARSYPDSKLYGSDAFEQSLIDEWLDFTQDSLSPSADYKTLSGAFTKLNEHLALRSFIEGHSLTLADIALWGALNSLGIFKKQMKSAKDFNLARWFAHLSSLPPFAKATETFDAKKTKANKSRGDQGSFDIPLPGATQGNVVTRFPPEPSGYLHIGHAKAALLNDFFAKQYGGKLLLRFDDTNPSKEKMEYEESIKEDLLLLGIKADMVSHTSDHFPKIYNYALEMIQKGLAYVDDTDQETMRAERFDGIDSKCRSLSVEENLKRFEEMRLGTEFGLKCCLRAKMLMQDKNKALRDPVIYRCNLIPHPHTGTRFKMYPTYDFVCPIVDSLEGVTHALRTNEYRDRNPQYEWFLKALNLRWVHIWDYSRLNFVYTLLSKRKLTWFVDNGHVTGWDDPRFATVRGIRRRGMTIEALRTYILSQGASQRELSLEWDKLWTVNKKVIDPVAPRHTALNKDKLVKVHLAGSVPTQETQLPKHKKNPDVGLKTTQFSPNVYIEFDDAKDLAVDEEVTFMDWGNVIIKNVVWNSDKTEITSVEAVLHLEGDFKKTKKKLTWLSQPVPGSAPSKSPVNLLLLDYDYLITKKKLEEDDKFEDFLTPVTEFKTPAVGDANLRQLKKGDVLQLERKGYYICDKPLEAADKPDAEIHLIYIPDGKLASTVAKNETPGAPPAEKKEGKAKKAEKKANQSEASTIKMYTMDPVYNKEALPKYTAVSKMYAVKGVYGEPEVEEVSVKNGAAADGKNVAKKDKKEKAPKAAAAAPAEGASPISKLDIVVGKILDVQKHPDADSLYVENIDVGEAAPRVVVSGLVKFMTPEEMTGKLVLILKNLKPVSMRGVKSHAMVLCASNDTHDKVEFLIPPPGSVPGDRVFFKGFEGEPEAILNPKKKVWESVQPDFTTRAGDLVALWKDVEWATSRGPVKTASIAKASIK